MSLAWFGPACRRSGLWTTATSPWIQPRAWALLLLWLLPFSVHALLQWGCTRSPLARFWTRRSNSKHRLRSLPMNTQSWSQQGLIVTLTERPLANQPPVVTATFRGRSISSYTLQETKNWLLERGLPADEPVMDWLLALELQGHE